jgi:transposase
MLPHPYGPSIFLYNKATDMRVSFDRLAALAAASGEAATSGSLFLFLNKRKDRIKMLFWDRNGFCQVYKRLEEGVFDHPRYNGDTEQAILISRRDLAMMLEGISFSDAVYKKRYALSE